MRWITVVYSNFIARFHVIRVLVKEFYGSP